MKQLADIVTEPTTLSELTDYPTLRRGLTAVTFFGFLSFLTSVALFLRLGWRLLTWKRRSWSEGTDTRTNQFVVLLFNLVFADIQQSIAFLLNAQWLSSNAITVNTSTCSAQGWFVSTGDLGSGIFTLAIAVHAFADIVFNFRLGQRSFGIVIVGLWVFNYLLAIIGLSKYPDDFYERAGAWCWINTKYTNERLWLHYFWVIIAEFGTVLIYALIFLILRRRVKESFYTDSKTLIRARSAAKVIIVYPIVYAVCTLPLVKARLTGMVGRPVSFLELTIAGAMITSNGWLDVLVYTITRRSLVFGPDIEEGGVLSTFPMRPDNLYGTTTVIESNNSRMSQQPGRKKLSHQALHSRNGSMDELFDVRSASSVKAKTTVVVRNDTVEMDALRRGTGSQADLNRKASFESRSQKSRLK